MTHPACVSSNGAHRPGFWTGNYILPRVAQWHDVLIAVHKLPEDDWMGFTHAFFPASVFDETNLRDGWAFGRQGDGYIALIASNGLELMKRGPATFHELRSYGQETIWICQMGRAALDGTFEEFQEKVLALDLNVDKLSLQFTTLRDETLAFGWDGPLAVNGEEQPLAGFKHYENPYSVTELHAEQMDIQFGELLMRLAFL